MGRIIAIDYGKKRCGIAATDPLKIIASPLTTVATHELFDFVKRYTQTEPVETIVMGYPTQVTGEESETMKYIRPFVNRLKKSFEGINIVMVDERFTTKLAFNAMLQAGAKKTDRNNKNGKVDMVSAAIILQTYMDTLR